MSHFNIFDLIFYVSCIVLIYIYVGYYLLLLIVSKFMKKTPETLVGETQSPTISIIVAAWNEERSIADRIKNLLAVNYPATKKEIIVASDGSKDRTIEIARSFKSINALDFKENRGRAYLHNDSVRQANGEIIIFTDAETQFHDDFLERIVSPFANPNVGAVIGNLTYRTDSRSGISEAEGLYFKLEKKLRLLESHLGILSSGTGACTAIRKSLWRNLSKSDDVDCATPLDIIMQNYRVVFQSSALAYDVPPSSIKEESKARIRQTSKDIQTIMRRWGLRGCIRHPLVSFGLASHKIFRWLTLFFALGTFIPLLLIPEWNWVHKLVFSGQLLMSVVAAAGFSAETLRKSIPICSTVFSFVLAVVAMGLGSIQGMMGLAPSSYRN